ncbi:MAG: peptide deformylase [Bacteroidota bacterium]
MTLHSIKRQKSTPSALLWPKNSDQILVFSLFMGLERILKLGDPRLYEVCEQVSRDELNALKPLINELHGLVVEFRQTYGVGRAIAASQIGLMKRIICYNVDQPVTMINPKLTNLSEEMFELWDDCMSFPNLLVKVKRHKACKLIFLDKDWKQHTWDLEGSLSELFQHEYDHLNGVLATMRALDDKSFKWR